MARRTAPTTLTVVAVVSVLTVLVLAGIPEVGSARASGTSGAMAGSVTATGSVRSTAFAYRAGYVSNRSGLVAGESPATGSPLLVVTFQPRSPSLYSTPAPGARPLTMTEIADRFGLTPQQYSAVEQYFVGEGLSIVHTWPDRLSLTLQGPVPAVDRAFGTTLLAGSYAGRAVSFPAVPPSLPPSIEPLVESVAGLSSGFTTFALPLVGAPPSSSGSATTADLITPGIARQIYDLSNLYNRTAGAPVFASSESIAVLLWGPGYVPSDLTTFFSQYYPSNFPSPKIVAVPVDGAQAPSASAGSDPCNAAEELTLDLEWSGSMAPGATLYAVYAPEGSPPGCSPSSAAMIEAMNTAIGEPVVALSMSFGMPESADASLSAAWASDLAVAAQRGITAFAATGDYGGATKPGCPQPPAVQYPSSSPDVIAVGGTDVSLLRNIFGQFTGFSETAWNDSGGGFSTQFSAPSWQEGLGNSMRGEPDVSATAALDFFYFNGQAVTNMGGTSFSTPLWAGLVTEMEAQYGKSLAPLAPRLYAIGEAETLGKIGIGLADITSGSNCFSSAGPGWDDVTGWGSPRALLLYEELTATIVSLSLSVTPTSIGPGGSVTLSAHLANATSDAPISGVPVHLTLSSSTSLGPCTGSFGSESPVTGPSGNVSVTMSVPSCYLGSAATALAVVQSNMYYGTNSTRLPVNLLAFVPGLSGLAEFPYNVIGFAAIFLVAGVIGYVLGRSRSRPVDSRIPPPSPPSVPVAPASTSPVTSGSVGTPPPAAPASGPDGVSPASDETTAEAPKTP